MTETNDSKSLEAASSRKMLVTIALPYANGAVHLGHLVEAIQADIWVRFQRMRNHCCYFICGDDVHGTPVMLAAQKKNMTPEDMVAEVHQERLQSYGGFHISFDHYYHTHSDENKLMAETVYNRLQQSGDIITKDIQQAFDEEKSMFLPDRFITGGCPRCHAANQYGDSCEVCGATYSPTDLEDARSVLSGKKPITKNSLHYFFQLANYQQKLGAWMKQGHLQPQVVNKLQEWFKDGLKDWDISRDAPYFGFVIPGTTDKYFYVWLDAPIGYMSIFQNYVSKNPQVSFEEFWQSDSSTELYHFIGKDIMYFHALFWPAILMGSGFRTPTAVFAHGFLTIQGEKMSKSRGTFITAENYLKHLNPEYLRYYFAAKLNQQIEDIDLNFEDFRQRVNSDLVGKYVNIASRCAGFIHKFFDSTCASKTYDEPLLQMFVDAAEDIAASYEARDYNRAMRQIMQLADKANQFVDAHKPWQLAKDPQTLADVQGICTQGLQMFAILTIYLKPVLPQVAEHVEDFLNVQPLQWHDIHMSLLGKTIKPFKALMQRVTAADCESLVDTSVV